jgi:hypothetical protein
MKIVADEIGGIKVGCFGEKSKSWLCIHLNVDIKNICGITCF